MSECRSKKGHKLQKIGTASPASPCQLYHNCVKARDNLQKGRLARPETMASDGEEHLVLFDLWPEPGANIDT